MVFVALDPNLKMHFLSELSEGTIFTIFSLTTRGPLTRLIGVYESQNAVLRIRIGFNADLDLDPA